MYSGPTDFTHSSRSYDDEDAALQAALKASMDDLPTDWAPPELKKPETVTWKPAPSETPRPVPSASMHTTGAGGSKFKEELEVDDEDVQTETLTAGE